LLAVLTQALVGSRSAILGVIAQPESERGRVLGIDEHRQKREPVRGRLGLEGILEIKTLRVPRSTFLLRDRIQTIANSVPDLASAREDQYFAGGYTRVLIQIPVVVKRKLRPLLQSLGIKGGGLHGFRHANTSFMDGLAAPMKVRQQRLGHSDSRLTMDVYTHVASADDERIAEQLGDLLDAVGQKQAFEAENEKGPALQQALVN
jgi:integrase